MKSFSLPFSKGKRNGRQAFVAMMGGGAFSSSTLQENNIWMDI
jgi:hypothetical protein